MANKEKPIGEATPEQIEAWKKKHGELKAVKVGGHVAYLKTPDRKAIAYASSVGTKDPLKFNEIILNNCFVGGSEEIKTDDTLFISVCKVLPDLIEIKEAELVNL